MSLFEYSEKFFQISTSSKNVHYCKCCPYFSTSIFLMINHVRRHRAPKRRFACTISIETYFCKDCDFRTSLTVLFKKHIRERHVRTQVRRIVPNENLLVRRYICAECNFVTYFSLKLMKHVVKSCLKDKVDIFAGASRVAAQKPKPPEANETTVNNLPKGRKRSATGGCGGRDVKRFKCDKCQYKGRQEYLLAAHKLNEHLPQTGKWKKCDECPYKIDKLSHLKRHKVSKHLKDSEIEWFYCAYCPFKGKLRPPLKRHILKEHPDKVYAEIRRSNIDGGMLYGCKKCPSKFQWRKTLKLHMIEKHDGDDVNWYKCDKCTYKTKNSTNLPKHQAVKHAKADKTDWLQCKYCIYKAKVEKSLSNHLLKKHPKLSKRSFNKPKGEDAEPPQLFEVNSDTPKGKLLAKPPQLFKVSSDSPKGKAPAKPPQLFKVSSDSPKGKAPAKPPRLFKMTSDESKEEKKSIATRSTEDIKWHNCDKCSYKTKYSRDLHKHHKSKHTEEKIVWYNCEYCPFKAKFEFSLNAHMNMHSKGSQLFNRSSYTPKGKENLIATRNGDIKWYNCDKCLYKTKYSENLSKHHSRKHPKASREPRMVQDNSAAAHNINNNKTKNSRDLPKRQIKCTDKFKQNLNDNRASQKTKKVPDKLKPGDNFIVTRLRDNSETENAGDLPKQVCQDLKVVYQCVECSQKFQGNESLRLHMIAKHTNENDVTWHKCDQCPYKSKFLKDLHHHKICRHLKDDEIEWFQCKYCGHKVKLLRQLRQHILNHHPGKTHEYQRQNKKNSGKTYPCDQCPNILQGEENFKRHVNTKHKTTYQCEHCDYKTHLQHVLRSHLTKIHNFKTGGGKSGANLVQCTKCSLECSPGSLRRHVISKHTDEKDIIWFYCKHCPYRAKRTDGLQVHVRNKHSKKNRK